MSTEKMAGWPFEIYGDLYETAARSGQKMFDVNN